MGAKCLITMRETLEPNVELLTMLNIIARGTLLQYRLAGEKDNNCFERNIGIQCGFTQNAHCTFSQYQLSGENYSMAVREPLDRTVD